MILACPRNSFLLSWLPFSSGAVRRRRNKYRV
jgi:hypothetical protein